MEEENYPGYEEDLAEAEAEAYAQEQDRLREEYEQECRWEQDQEEYYATYEGFFQENQEAGGEE